MDSNGYPLTGRHPDWIKPLIEAYGDDIWMGVDGNADRGDRHSQRMERARAAANRKDTPPMASSTTKPSNTAKEMRKLIGLLRTAFSGEVAVDPVDKDAPIGTQRRRIAAYNALHDLARPGRDRYCGKSSSTLRGPCILKDGHAHSEFDDLTSHMDAASRERALRYLVHSDPDPDKRA